MIWREFKAMGTEIVICADLEPEKNNLLIEMENEIVDFESRFSRFIEGNELSTFNNSTLEKKEISKTMQALLRESEHYYESTKGVFDLTIISNLEAFGYDKTFEKAREENSEEINLEKVQGTFNNRPKMDDIKISNNEITSPLGLKIDFGGIGKGFVIDYLSQQNLSHVENYWISAGGDIIVSGNQKHAIGWDIGVQNPNEPDKNVFSINTQGEKIGIATSGIIKRAGKKGDFDWHHIIDPRSGLPVKNNILSVTAISSSALRADIFAKTVLILGEKAGIEFIEQELDSACIIFLKDKEPIFSQRAGLYLKNI
ncbi:MAG: FAD:protein FMN transferase [Patescibacteria group bacterium]